MIWRAGARLSGWSPVFPGRREREAQRVDCGVRLIFEGWVPHDPVFVAVRVLRAGAAGGRVVAGCP